MTTNHSTRERIANQLKQTRLDRKLSIGKLSKELKIPESTLKDLENSSDTTIPASHLPGLARRYAQHLGLADGDIESMLADPDKTQASGLQRRRQRKSRSPIVLSRLTSIAAVGVAAAVVAGYALFQIYGLTSNPRLTVTEPASDTVATQSDYEVRGRAGADTSVLVNGDPVVLSEDGEFAVTIYLQEGRNSLEVSAINNFSRQTTIQRTIYYQSELE